jgi:predicted Zn-ribbon and HTH transcriptional regulator
MWSGERLLEDALFYRCGECGYEFLAKTQTAVCPRCKSTRLEAKDIKYLAGIDE